MCIFQNLSTLSMINNHKNIAQTENKENNDE